MLGQPDFVSGSCDNGGVTASSLCAPFAVSADSRGDLYVADQGNSRVLEFSSPLASSMAANLVFGQGNSFSTDTCDFDGLSGTADNLCDPSGVALDVIGNLYIADTDNNRALEYDQPLIIRGNADRNRDSYGERHCHSHTNRNRHGHANRDCDENCDTDGDKDCHCNRDQDCNCHGNRHEHGDADRNCHSLEHGDCHGYRDKHRDGDGHGHQNRDRHCNSDGDRNYDINSNGNCDADAKCDHGQQHDRPGQAPPATDSARCARRSTTPMPRPIRQAATARRAPATIRSFSASAARSPGNTLPAILNNLTIDGTGQTITVDGANLFGIFVVGNRSVTLNINLLTIAHGNASSGDGNGGGIDNHAGTLAVANSTFSNNSARMGAVASIMREER